MSVNKTLTQKPFEGQMGVCLLERPTGSSLATKCLQALMFAEGDSLTVLPPFFFLLLSRFSFG